jgi:lactoylglutathione lyase
MSADKGGAEPLIVVTGLTAGVPVSDLGKAVEFHRAWLRRDPDVVPQPDIAEWEVTPGTYLQFFQNPKLAGNAVMRLGIDDAAGTREALVAAGIDVTPLEEVGGFLRYCDFRDPDGNRFSLIELTEDS